MKLYEITGAMLDTLDIFLESDGTDLDQENYGDIILFLRDELENKSSKIIEYIKNLEAESKVAKEEANRLQELSKSRQNKIKRLKEYLVNTMEVLNKKKIETNLGTYGLRKISKVEIYDLSLLPKEFVKQKTTKEADKIAIGQYIKENGELDGARMVRRYSLNIR